jgi:hypothetical protein
VPDNSFVTVEQTLGKSQIKVRHLTKCLQSDFTLLSVFTELVSADSLTWLRLLVRHPTEPRNRRNASLDVGIFHAITLSTLKGSSFDALCRYHMP